LFVQDVTGVEWGVLAMMSGEEKPQRYTDRYHYIFFVVRGRAYFTLGDEYTVLLTRAPVVEGSTINVPRGNYYSIKNANASTPVTLIFYKATHVRRSAEQKNAGESRNEGRTLMQV
jgi:mannose-6-phosphate isomerase-like protein (cupin superfamily)